MLKNFFFWCFLACSVRASVLQDFSQEHLPLKIWKERKSAYSSLEYVKDGLLIRWNAAQNPYCIIGEAWKKPFIVQAFKHAVCRIDVKIMEPSQVNSLHIRFRDSAGEVFQWKSPNLDFRKPGDHQITISMTPENFAHAFGGNKNRKIDFPMRFYSFLVSAPRNSSMASLIVKKIDFKYSPSGSALYGVKFDIETGNAARVLKKGEEKNLKFRLENPYGQPIPCRAKIEFRDISGHVISENAEFSLPANKRFEYFPKVRLPLLGYWKVKIRLESLDGSTFIERTRSLAYMKPAGPGKIGKEGFVFGVCIPGWYDTKIFPLEAETASLCGASALRLNFRWRELESSPGKWLLEKTDRIMAEYEKRGIEVMPILSNPPVWARSDKKRPNSLPDFHAWRNYLGTLFRRYGDRIRFWEIWNEPELSGFCDFSAPEYVQLQKIAREEQKKFAPHASLMTGGFATAYPDRGKKGFQEYSLRNGKAYYDIHAFHGHGGFKAYRKHVEDFLLPMRKRAGVSVPWFANETGVSAFGIGERDQGEALFKKFLFSWANEAVGYNWYNLRNNGSNAGDPEHQYGLVTVDFYPKPVYLVYNTLALIYRNMKFVRRVRSEKDIFILEFSDGKDHAVGVWNEDPKKTVDELAVFQTDAKSVEIIDLMGNHRKASIVKGLAVHRISCAPETLFFRDASHVKYMGSPVKGRVSGVSVPGRTAAELKLSLFNPFFDPQTVRLKFKEDKLQIGKIPSEIRLSPGETKTISTDIMLTRNVHGILMPELSVSYPGFHIDLAFPMENPLLIPAGVRKENEWDFILRNRDQVRSLFDADPNNAHRYWNGPKDLSARIRLALQNETLNMKFAVTDDKHVQPYKGVNVWKGDNIQIALSFPGQKGLWIAGLSLLADGQPEIFLWEKPAAFIDRNPISKWHLNARRSGTLTEYEVQIPLDSIGMTGELLKKGFRFSALINENDGFGRDGWIQVSDGVESNRSEKRYPIILFDQDQR